MYFWRMRAKWYIATCILSLAFLGLFTQPKQVVPNQELVLQFNEESTQTAIEQTIVQVQNQLLEVGATNIKVIDANGSLRITYYSEADVDQVKEVLLDDRVLASEAINSDANNTEELPLEKYAIDVYELIGGKELTNDFEGILVIETKSRADRFFLPSLDITNRVNETKRLASSLHVAHKYYSTYALSIDTLSRNVPEVRAGPKA